jgi:predicted transcriptional regulator
VLSKEDRSVARPAARELTERELEVMHQYWKLGETTIAEVRDALAAEGTDLAHTTVATLVRILAEKGFLEQTNEERPFRHRPIRSFDDVSKTLVGDIIDRVFRGSRESLLQCLFGEQRLSAAEKARIRKLLEGDRS